MDRNESADRIDRDRKRDVGDVARFQFFQGVFFHIRVNDDKQGTSPRF